LARRAQRRVVAEFSQERVWRAFEEVYGALLAQGEGKGGRATASLVARWRFFAGRPTLTLSGPPAARVRAEDAAVAGACRPAGLPRNTSGPAASCWALSTGKRALDVVGACLGLAAASPLLLLVAGIIGLSMGRPILFRQPRAGLARRPFLIYKFRTMAGNDCRDAAADAERLTTAGRLLRRWSLDELPQLGNVLRGEMSLVGPRPLPVHYEPRYTARQGHRHDVRPGITGWAQVRGRNSLSWEERFELDLWYVEHSTAWLDFQILIRSVASGRQAARCRAHAGVLR
jgi:lipopolysaccharide/colanic/teichoic acid biosynthesis glycosyltransferase